MNLPDWYDISLTNNVPSASVRSRRSILSVRKALASIGEVLAVELSGANRTESWLSDIEPRAKVLGILVLVFGVTLLNNLLPLAILLGITIIVSLSTRIPFRRLGRLWLGVPLFSAAIILPAALNIVTPGNAIWTITHFGEGARFLHWNLPSALTVTDNGLIVAFRFILRSVSCITLTALLVSSTDSSTLVNALRRLGMPRVFGMTLAMMQRYMSLLLRTAEEIHLAKLSRTINSDSVRDEQKWVAAGIGVLFGRTYRLAEEVRLAMVSRGYDGDLRVRQASEIRFCDFWWAAGVLVVGVGVFLVERFV